MSQRAEKLDEVAQIMWKNDAEEAGLEGLRIEEAVTAVMFNSATATLPDPLSLPRGTEIDKDNWLIEAERAGLFIDDEDLIMLSFQVGDGSGLAVIKEEPVDPDEAPPIAAAAENEAEAEPASEAPTGPDSTPAPEPSPEPEAGPSRPPAKRPHVSFSITFRFFDHLSIFQLPAALYPTLFYRLMMMHASLTRRGRCWRVSVNFEGVSQSRMTRY